MLPPDVNSSERDFVAVGKDIRFGLGAIRNVVDAITRARTEKGSYTDFSDFLRKVDAVPATGRSSSRWSRLVLRSPAPGAG